MTTDEYITMNKLLLPVHPGRFESLIKDVFNEMMRQKYFVSEKLDIDFRVISSASIFSEVVYTKPQISLIWDNYQWELIEKFYLAGICALNGNKREAEFILKTNINAVISLRLTSISPEMSYVIAKHYREQLHELDADYIVLNQSFPIELLYCQFLTLGHEMSHIIFENSEYGRELFYYFEHNFTNFMDSFVKIKPLWQPYEGARTVSEMYNSIMKDSNSSYRKELICDIFSYILMGEIMEKIDKKVTPSRNVQELYNDIFEMNRFTLMMLDSFLYILEYWTRLGIKSQKDKLVKAEFFFHSSPNYFIWNTQFDARETLVFEYIRGKLLSERGLFVEKRNRKITAVYNEIVIMFRNLMELKDSEWLDIVNEANSIYAMNIDKKELLLERDVLLFQG